MAERLHITEEIMGLELDGDEVRSAAAYLEGLYKTYPQDFELRIVNHFDDGYVLEGTRCESDKEYNARMKKIEKAKGYNKQRKVKLEEQERSCTLS